MPFISKDFIKNKLLPNLDIVQVLQQYVTLKKKGANYMCCCPFHSEKTPSFSVNPNRQFFYCFGCQEHGTVIDFVIKYKNETFPEAVEELARFAGLEVEYEEGTGHGGSTYRPDPDRNKVYYELLDRVASYFSKELYQPSNQAALDYFLKQRQLSSDIISKARLGYAPKEMYALQDSVIKTEEEAKILCELGVVKPTPESGPNKRYRSFFFDRVMFPIFDVKGRIIAFGGRILKGDGPKYLNSPESNIFQKRHELFGLYECLQANRNRPNSIVMVEGYMDVIALRKAGFTNVVATLGTACNSDHFKMLFRYTSKVICCYDGDDAGRKASWKALIACAQVTPEDKEVRFATIPAGDDPDSLVRSEGGKERFQKVLESSIGFTEQILLHCRSQDNVNDIEGLRRFINMVLSIAKALKSKSRQNAIVMLLSDVVNLNNSRLYEIMNNVSPDSEFKEYEPHDRSGHNSYQERGNYERSHSSYGSHSQGGSRGSGTYTRKSYNSGYGDRGGRSYNNYGSGYSGSGQGRSSSYDYMNHAQPRASQAFKHEALTPFHGSYANKAYGQGARVQANQAQQEPQNKGQSNELNSNNQPNFSGNSNFHGYQRASQEQFNQSHNQGQTQMLQGQSQFQGPSQGPNHRGQSIYQSNQGGQSNLSSQVRTQGAVPQSMQPNFPQGGQSSNSKRQEQGRGLYNSSQGQQNIQSQQGHLNQQGVYDQNQLAKPWQSNAQGSNNQSQGNYQSKSGGYVNNSNAQQGNSQQGHSYHGQNQGPNQSEVNYQGLQGGTNYQYALQGQVYQEANGHSMQEGQGQVQGHNFTPNGRQQENNVYQQGGNNSLQGNSSQSWSNMQGPQSSQGQQSPQMQQGPQGSNASMQGGQGQMPYGGNNFNQASYQGQGQQMPNQGYNQEGISQQGYGPNNGNWSNYMSQGNQGMNSNMGYGMNQGKNAPVHGGGSNRGKAQESPSNIPQVKGKLVEVDPLAKIPVWGGDLESPEFLFSLTDDERFTYFSLVGHEYNANVDLNASVYQYMAFILQEPSVVVMGMNSFDYLNFLALCQGFRIPEYPCLERLMRLVTTTSDPTCAKILEEFRDTEFYPLFCDLAQLQILGKYQGDLDNLSTRDLLLLNRSLMLQILKDSVERRLHQLNVDFRMPRYKELEANLANMLIRFMFLEDRMDKVIDLDKCNRFSMKITEMINDIIQDKKRNYLDGSDPSKPPKDEEHTRLLASVPSVVDNLDPKR